MEPTTRTSLDKLYPDHHFLRMVQDGMAGGNVAMPNGMPGLSKYIYGTLPARYYLIGADSGVGKTTIADFMYVFNLYEYCKRTDRKLYIFYYSFEISIHDKKARWVSMYVKMKFNLDIPSDYILGRIPGQTVTDEHFRMIEEAYASVEDIFNNMVFIEDPIHPTKIFSDLVAHHFEKIGEVKRVPGNDPKRKGQILSYTPKDKRAVTIGIVDHVALTHSEQGMDTKGTIDLLSKYIVILRNLFGMSWVVIQQFNTDLMSYHRMNKKGDGLIAPQRLDFGDSKYTYRDADVVIGLLKPFIYDVGAYHLYDITRLKGYFIAAHLMKNRYGTSYKILPLFLNPIAGIPEDLPLTPTLDLAMDPYYLKAEKLDSICLSFSPKNQ